MGTATTSSPQSSSSLSNPIRQIQVTRVYEKNAASKKPIVINVGGARSSKSHSIGQNLIQKFINIPQREILVTRKYGPALTRTALRLIVRLLSDYGIYGRLRHNKSEGTIINPSNGSMFSFISVDDPEKIKSTEFNDVWLEEASEFEWDDWLVIQTRMSAPTTPEHPNQIYLSLNPGDEQGWINQRILLGPTFAQQYDLIRSTYKDNPTLNEEYIRVLEGLKEQDFAAYQVYALGEWAALRHVIYNPYEIVPQFPDSFDEVIFGLDFGFNNPSALLQIGIKDGRHYLRQMLYETGLTNSDLIARVDQIIPKELRTGPVYCDAAEPDRIAEFERAGFNVFPADKEVKTGIDFCKRIKFLATSDSTDLLKERGSYKWKSDRNGNILDEPVKFMDHLMDAKRYAIYTHEKDRITMPGYA